MSDTFERSLAHWSEAGREGMNAFYSLATTDYRVLAEAHNWATWLRQAQIKAGRALRLLDVACGSGKFPAALLRHGTLGQADLQPIAYALLDPSAFSIAEARGVLQPPFHVAQTYNSTIQDLDAAAGAFDIVWATHALYAVPPAEIHSAIERFVDVCAGQGFIAHAASSSHYIVFDRLYRAAFTSGERTPYTTAEEVIESLKSLGVRFVVRDVEYESVAPRDAESAVEGFLQRCVFDDTRTLDEMMLHGDVGAYLARCRFDDSWRFPQTVKLIFIDV